MNNGNAQNKKLEILKNFLLKHENIGALVVYAILICIFYSPVVFFNRSLISATYHPYTVTENGAYGYEGRKPAGAFNVDVTNATYVEYPVSRLIGEQYKSGQLPLWNPYKGIGEPIPQQLGSSVYFPYQILEDVFPVSLTDFFYLGRFILAGFFTFLFLRALKLSRISSLIGGMFFMLSGVFTWFLNNEQMVNPAMMIPLVMWTAEKLLISDKSRYILGFALSLLALIVSGAPGIIIYALFLIIGYFLFRLFFDRSSGLDIIIPKWQKIFIILLTINVVFLLSSPLALPFISHLDSSYALRSDGGIATIKSLNIGFVFFPGLSDIQKNYTFGVGNGKWDEVGSYLGIGPLILIIFGLLAVKNIKNSRIFLFFLIFGSLILFKNFGWFFLNMIGKLPVLNDIWSQRWGAPTWTFSLICAAALGMEAIKNNRVQISNIFYKFTKYGLTKLATVTSFFLFFMIFWVLNGFDQISISKKMDLQIIIFYYLSCVTIFWMTIRFITSKDIKHNNWLALFVIIIAERWFLIPFGYQTPLLKLPTFGLALIGAVLVWKNYKKLAFIFFALTILSFNAIDYYSLNGLPSRFNPLVSSPYINFLKSQNTENYRVLGTNGTLMPNMASAFAIQDFRHISTMITKDLYAFKRIALNDEEDYPFWFMNNPPLNLTPVDANSYKLFCGKDYEANKILLPLNDRLPFYSLLGIKYFLIPKTSTLDSIYDILNPELFPLVYNKEIKIYENPFVLPRTFISPKIKFANSYLDADQELKKLVPQEISQTIFLEEIPQELTTPNTIQQKYGNKNIANATKIISYSSNKIIIRAKTEQNGFLVLTDQYDPNWKATINGKPTKIYRADGLFRSVYVEKGDNQIVFEYKDDELKFGGLLALSAIPGLILLCLWRKKQTKFYPIILLAILGVPFYQFYTKLGEYAVNYNAVHSFPKLTIATKTKFDDTENTLFKKRAREMNFISKHFLTFFPNEINTDHISSVLQFKFPAKSVMPIFVTYKNGDTIQGIIINIAQEDNPDFPYSDSLIPIMNVLKNNYTPKYMAGEEISSPPYLITYAQDAGILRIVYYVWTKAGKIMELKTYYTTALYDFTTNHWFVQANGNKPTNTFRDTYQYDCKLANWIKN